MTRVCAWDSQITITIHKPKLAGGVAQVMPIAWAYCYVMATRMQQQSLL